MKWDTMEPRYDTVERGVKGLFLGIIGISKGRPNS